MSEVDREALTERLKQLRAKKQGNSAPSSPVANVPVTPPNVNVIPSSPPVQRHKVPVLPQSNLGLSNTPTPANPIERISPRSPRRTDSWKVLPTVPRIGGSPAPTTNSPTPQSPYSPSTDKKTIAKDEVLKRLQKLREKKGTSPSTTPQKTQTNTNNEAPWQIPVAEDARARSPSTGFWKKSPSQDFLDITASSDLLFESEYEFTIDLTAGKTLATETKNFDDEQLELPLPSNDWHRVVDPVTLLPFYVNELTGVTTSTHPYYLYGTTWTGMTMDDLSGSSWSRYYDSETNNFFYYNSDSGETSWFPPSHTPIDPDRSTKQRSRSTRVPPSPQLTNITNPFVVGLPTSHKKLMPEITAKRAQKPRKIASLGNSWEHYLLNFFPGEGLKISEDAITAISLPKGIPGFDLWQLYSESMMSSRVSLYSEVSLNRPTFGWKSNLDLTNDAVQLALSVRSFKGIPAEKLEHLQLSIALWHEDTRLSDEFCVDLVHLKILNKTKLSSLFTNIQIPDNKIIDVVLLLSVSGHPILQDRFSILINEIKMKDVVSVPFGFSVDIEHEIPILGAILEFTIGAYHCVYKDESVGSQFVMTRSQGISVADLLPPNVRNDVYISIDLEKFISAAAQKKILLPSAFRIVATLVGKDGEQLLDLKPLVGNFPENFNYSESKIALPKSALEDFQSHIVFQILGSENSENIVPQVNKFVKPSHNRSDAATILKTPPVYDVPAAYGILMIYTNPGQLRSDRTYEIQLFEGRAPTKKSPLEKGTIKCDLTANCKESLQEFDGNMTIPSYLSAKRGDQVASLSVGLPLFFRVVSGSLLEDDVLQNFLDSESKPKEQLKEILQEQGNLFQGTNIYDIFKFHNHILAKISKLYRYQQSNHIMTELNSLWDLLTSVIATMSYSDSNLSLLHTKFQSSLRESFEGTELLKEYLDYIVDKKLKVYVKQATHGDYPDKIFITLNFCFCYLLSGIFQHSMDLFDMNYLASLITSLFEINNGALRAFPTQETKAMVMKHMKLLYPYLLSVIASQDLVDYFRRLLTIKKEDTLVSGYVTNVLGFLTHLYQYDQASKWKRSELYLQVALLPTVSNLLALFLIQLRDKSDSVWNRESVQTSLMEVLACIFLLLLPLLWQNAQQRVASTNIKSITSDAFAVLWAPAVLLLDVPPRSTESTTVCDSTHCLCVSAYFSLLAANQGQILHEILARFQSTEYFRFFATKLFSFFYRSVSRPPFVSYGFHRLVLKLTKEQFAFVDLLLNQSMLNYSALSQSELENDQAMLSSLFQYLVTIPLPMHSEEWTLNSSNNNNASAINYLESFDQLRIQCVQLLKSIAINHGKLTCFSVDTIAASLIRLYLDSEEQASMGELALESLLAMFAVNYLAHKTLFSVKKALFKCLGEYRDAGNQNRSSIELLTSELSMFIEDPSKLLPPLIRAQQCFPGVTGGIQLEVNFVKKTSKLMQLFRSMLEDFQDLSTYGATILNPGNNNEHAKERLIDALQHLATQYCKCLDIHCLEFIDNLLRIHSGSLNYREWGYMLVYQYDTVLMLRNNSNSALGSPLSAQIDTSQLELPAEGLVEAIKNFNKIEDWEGALGACERLVHYYEHEEFDYAKAADCMQQSASLHKKIAEFPRIPILFYGMFFTGSAFPSRLDGHTFIYRLKEQENFPQFSQRVNVLFPDASLLMPKDSLPNYKPAQSIQLFPVYPCQGVGKDPQQFYSFHEIDELSQKSNEHIRNAIDRWNSYFVPSYILAGNQQEIPLEIRKSSSLPPAEPPCYRVIYAVDPALLGSSKRIKVAKITKSVIPGVQASIEWLIFQESRLRNICDIVSSIHSKKIQSTELWCHACKGRPADSAKLKSESIAPQTRLEDATGILKWILVELLTPETTYVTGFRKIKQILEKNAGREAAMHAKIKETISKAWVKEQKRCKEQGLPVPPKPNVETLQVVTDPLIVSLKEKLVIMETTLSLALLLHQKLGAGSEQEINEHEDLEVLYYNALRL